MTDSSTTDEGARLRRDILTTLLPGFSGTELPDWVRALLSDGLGGVCLFGMNVQDPAQLAALDAEILAANPDAVIAIDEEGGEVTRLFYDIGSPFPGNAVLGRIDDTALTERVGRRVGEALAVVGVNVDFAPDVDVNSNPDNPVIGTRSFGTDQVLVARHGAAWTRGLQSAGVAAAAKHFPGHGDTAVDSHLGVPVVDRSLDELAERELVPFAAAIEAGTKVVMTSHILLPQLDADAPATLSPRVLAVLRERLGFEGVIVSDALDMHGASGETGIPEAAVRGLVAGCDLLCIGSDNSADELADILAAVAAAVESGRLPASRVAEAAGRVRALTASLRPADAAPASGGPASGAVASAAPVFAVEADADERDRVAASFRVAAEAAAVLGAAGSIGTVVRVETEANIAVGTAPWGPFAAVAQGAPHAERLTRAREVVLSEDAPVPPADPAGPVLVIGRDLHRYGFVREAVDALRAGGAAVVTVDCGWPSPDFGYADVATYGSSRLVGEALLVAIDRLLGGSE